MTSTTDLKGKNNMLLRFAISIALILGIGLFARVSAQVVGATLNGTITDTSGGVVPNAEVVIKNTATGDARTVSSNADGIYSVSNLLPGDYTATFSAAGFSNVTRSGITMTVGATLLLNLTMQVGQAAQNVEVTAEVPLMNLTNAEIGGFNDETTIKELPLNGRSWTDLAALEPGVFTIHTQPAITVTDRLQRGFGDQISISGSRPQGNNYGLNGISINDETNGGPGSVLGGNMGVDAISEFSVLSGNYSAEYGRASGGVVNAITKSGTNSFHGDVYEFLRNAAMDARNYFDYPPPPERIPPFRRNQFGASAGAPIRKNKTFIFADYEGLRQYLSISQSDTVPSAAARAGFLTNPPTSTYSNGGPPLPANFACPAGSSILMPGVSNTCVDNQATRYLNAFYPLPNGQVFGDTGFFNLSIPQPTTENYFITRVDEKISDNDRLSGSFFYDYSNTTTGDEFLNKTITTVSNRYYVGLDETHTFSATTTNDLRAGFQHLIVGSPAATAPLTPAASDTSYGFLPGRSAGQIQVTGVLTTFSGGLSAAALQTSHWATPQVYDDVSVTKGIHSIKFGAGFERDQLNRYTCTRCAGAFNFNTLSGFLTNNPAAISTQESPGTPLERLSIFGTYVQDDVRLRHNLTLNLGLRYEMNTTPSEVHNLLSNLINVTDQAPHLGNPYFHNNTLRNFEPRVGFAWDPFGTGKTSVRSGFGIYDMLDFLGQMSPAYGVAQPSGNFTGVPPPGSFPTEAVNFVEAASKSVELHWDDNPKRSYVMQWNIAVQREILPNFTALIGYVGNHGVHGIVFHDDVNIVPPIASPVGYLWPCEPFVPSGPGAGCQGEGSGTVVNPKFGRIMSENFRNSSSYNGLQVQLNKRMSHGFQVEGSFTWSKSLDIASGGAVGDTFINGISTLFDFINPNLTRAPSDFNSPRVLSINYIWNIPTPKSLQGLAGAFVAGWQIGGLFTASDGQPFTALLAGDPLGTNSTDPFGYPDRLTGPGCNSLINPRSVTDYIKLQCFAIPAAVNVGGTYYLRLGNEGRNNIPGPGIENLDFSLVKDTHFRRISESFDAQFRVEVFNIFNRANFQSPIDNEVIMDPSIPGFGIAPANPATAILPGAGAIDKTTTTSRQMQIALKLIW